MNTRRRLARRGFAKFALEDEHYDAQGLVKIAPEEPPRHCRNPDCGKLLVRRDGEYPYQWRQRTTCGIKCGTSVGGRASAGTPQVIVVMLPDIPPAAHRAAQLLAERLGVPILASSGQFTASLTPQQIIDAAAALSR